MRGFRDSDGSCPAGTTGPCSLPGLDAGMEDGDVCTKKQRLNTFHKLPRHFECLLGMRASWSWHRGLLQRTRGSGRHWRANWGCQRRRRVNLDLSSHNECTLVRQRAHFHMVRRRLSRGRLHWRRGHNIIYTISATGPPSYTSPTTTYQDDWPG